MKAATSIAIDSHLMELLRRMAEDDRRTVSDTVAILVEREAVRRELLKPPGNEPAKKGKGGTLSAVG